MVEELPIGAIGATFPVVVMAIGDGIVPNGEPGVIAAAGVIDEVVITAVSGIAVLLGAGDGVGTGTGAREGDGRGGTAGGCGAGMFEPGKSVMNDVAGCADSVRYGAVALAVGGDAAAVVGGIVPTIAGLEATGTGGVPAAI